MHRFYLPASEIAGKVLTLREADAHHAARVLRLMPGAEATVLDGEGREYSCHVSAVTKREVSFQVDSHKTHPAPLAHVTLLQAIPKAKLMDSIIQKATELGVITIVPLLTERVTTQLDGEAAADKAEKYQRVAIEAIKQSGNPWLPKIAIPQTPEKWIQSRATSDLTLIASLADKSTHAHSHFQSYRQQNSGRNPSSISIWIGPEGDFTRGETEQAVDSGAHPITLGKLVLRCETAATYCLSIVNYELGLGQ